MTAEGSEGARFSSASDAVEAILQRTLFHAEDGEWQEVAELLQAGLMEHPDDPYLLCWLGLAEREMGLDAVASERFRAALDQEPHDPVLLATAGNALAASDDPAAEAALRTAALIAPDLPQARWMYGAYLSREGMTAEALGELEAALALSPDDPVIHLEKGAAHALAGDFEAAAACFAFGTELDPEDGWGLILLGLARAQLGESEEAVPPLEEGARRRPDDFDAQILACLALAGSGWDERALEMLERARIQSADEDDALLLEVEAGLAEGPEASLRLLTGTLGPTSLRDRLRQRP